VTNMLPLSKFCCPSNTFIRDVLPEPFGPTSPIREEESICRVTPENISMSA